MREYIYIHKPFYRYHYSCFQFAIIALYLTHKIVVPNICLQLINVQQVCHEIGQQLVFGNIF